MASDVTLVAKWNIVEGEYAMKYNFNVTDSPVTQITKKAYAGGSKVTFRYNHGLVGYCMAYRCYEGKQLPYRRC